MIEDRFMGVLWCCSHGKMAELTSRQARDYEYFKYLALHQFGLSTEQLRRKFRAATPEPKETYASFANRLQRIGTKWVESANACTFHDLFELILKEQIYQAVPADYVMLVKAQRPKTVVDLAQLLDEIIDANQSVTDNHPGFYKSAVDDLSTLCPKKYNDGEAQKKPSPLPRWHSSSQPELEGKEVKTKLLNGKKMKSFISGEFN
ncbi:UNVERIFIED_CONTAM: hypothetical protein K2H54_016671 [Gekko kuhli]